jgi:hypothetical protein
MAHQRNQRTLDTLGGDEPQLAFGVMHTSSSAQRIFVEGWHNLIALTHKRTTNEIYSALLEKQ